MGSPFGYHACWALLWFSPINQLDSGSGPVVIISAHTRGTSYRNNKHEFSSLYSWGRATIRPTSEPHPLVHSGGFLFERVPFTVEPIESSPLTPHLGAECLKSLIGEPRTSMLCGFSSLSLLSSIPLPLSGFALFSSRLRHTSGI